MLITTFYLGADNTDPKPRDLAAIGRFLGTVGIPGATLQHATGFWLGREEPAVVVTILGPVLGGWTPGDLAARLAREYGQDAVAWAQTPGAGGFQGPA